MLSHNLKDDLPRSQTGVPIDGHNLLPGSQHQLTLSERNDQARAHDGGLHMAPTVVIAPPLVVFIGDVGRSDPRQRLGQVILHQSRFVLNRRNRTG